MHNQSAINRRRMDLEGRCCCYCTTIVTEKTEFSNNHWVEFFSYPFMTIALPSCVCVYVFTSACFFFGHRRLSYPYHLNRVSSSMYVMMFSIGLFCFVNVCFDFVYMMFYILSLCFFSSICFLFYSSLTTAHTVCMKKTNNLHTSYSV